MLGLLLNKILDTPLPSIYYCKQSTLKAIQTRKFVIENLRLVCLPDLTADFGVKTNAKLTPVCPVTWEEQNWYSELSVHSNPDSNFGVNFLTYIL